MERKIESRKLTDNLIFKKLQLTNLLSESVAYLILFYSLLENITARHNQKPE